MANLTLIDRLQLVKAGYKAKQIEEMIIKDSSEPLTSEEPAATTSEGDVKSEQVKEEVETLPANENKDEPDYKSMFENLQKEFDETKKRLEAAQKANASMDVSANIKKEDTQTTINNIFKDILS